MNNNDSQNTTQFGWCKSDEKSRELEEELRNNPLLDEDMEIFSEVKNNPDYDTDTADVTRLTDHMVMIDVNSDDPKVVNQEISQKERVKKTQKEKIAIK